jgi:TBC1 domain family member 2
MDRRSISQPKTPSTPSGLPHSSPLPGTPTTFNDFITDTDDDWNADLSKVETTEDILASKLLTPRSIEHRPQISSRLSGSSRNDGRRTPSYPSTKRKGSNGLKPQIEGLVRGNGLSRNVRVRKRLTTHRPGKFTPHDLPSSLLSRYPYGG